MYRQIEEIGDRKGEKIVLFFTLEHIVGIGFGGISGLLVFNALFGSFLFGMLGASLLGLVGFVATMDYGGLAGYERLQWHLRGRLRCIVKGSHVSTETLAGAQSIERKRDRPLPTTGAIRVVRQTTTVDTIASRLRSNPDVTADRKEDSRGHLTDEQPAH